MTRTPRRLTLLVVAAAAALFTATTMLARAYHGARAAGAAQHLETGRRLAAEGDLSGAIAEYRSALEFDRDNLAASGALALALLDIGRHSEAERHLIGLLQREPTDGPINRGMARIAAANGVRERALIHYQRAIYGRWPDDATDGRIETRFELHDYLRTLGARQEAFAELIRLKPELVPTQTTAMRRLASLLEQAGAQTEAVDTLTAAAAAAPRDVELLAHLARMELQAGRPAAARATLRRAVALEPRRRDLRDQATVIEQVLALDPTLPRLRLVDRTRRARRVLASVVQHTAGCPDDSPAAALRTEAATQMRGRAATDAEAAEHELVLAARLWSSAADCRERGPEADALTEILARVVAEPELPPS